VTQSPFLLGYGLIVIGSCNKSAGVLSPFEIFWCAGFVSIKELIISINQKIYFIQL
jgi:hypothetical protein